jgi:hypothetical protein
VVKRGNNGSNNNNNIDRTLPMSLFAKDSLANLRSPRRCDDSSKNPAPQNATFSSSGIANAARLSLARDSLANLRSHNRCNDASKNPAPQNETFSSATLQNKKDGTKISLFSMDSLVCLRAHKRFDDSSSHSAPKNASFSSRMHDGSENSRKHGRLPMDDLQERVAAKRCKLGISVHQKKSMTFAMHQNQVYERHLTDEDLSRAWMSPIESDWIKDSICITVATFRGGCFDASQDTIRGLEYRATNAITEKKILKNHHFRKLMLAQQKFFQGMAAGTAHDLMLSKLSQLLSADDVHEAVENAAKDVEAVLADVMSEQASSFSCADICPGALEGSSRTALQNMLSHATARQG